MIVRELSLKELEEALLLIQETFLATEAKDCDPRGIGSFLGTLSLQNSVVMVQEEGFTFHGAFHEDHTLVGVLGAREEYTALLFVRVGCFGKGIGGGLLSCYEDKMRRKRPHEGHLKVNAAPSSVTFYQRKGFVVEGPQRVIFGIPFVPMGKNIPKEDSY